MQKGSKLVARNLVGNICGISICLTLLSVISLVVAWRIGFEGLDPLIRVYAWVLALFLNLVNVMLALFARRVLSRPADS